MNKNKIFFTLLTIIFTAFLFNKKMSSFVLRGVEDVQAASCRQVVIPYGQEIPDNSVEDSSACQGCSNPENNNKYLCGSKSDCIQCVNGSIKNADMVNCSNQLCGQYFCTTPSGINIGNGEYGWYDKEGGMCGKCDAGVVVQAGQEMCNPSNLPDEKCISTNFNVIRNMTWCSQQNTSMESCDQNGKYNIIRCNGSKGCYKGDDNLTHCSITNTHPSPTILPSVTPRIKLSPTITLTTTPAQKISMISPTPTPTISPAPTFKYTCIHYVKDNIDVEALQISKVESNGNISNYVTLPCNLGCDDTAQPNHCVPQYATPTPIPIPTTTPAVSQGCSGTILIGDTQYSLSCASGALCNLFSGQKNLSSSVPGGNNCPTAQQGRWKAPCCGTVVNVAPTITPTPVASQSFRSVGDTFCIPKGYIEPETCSELFSSLPNAPYTAFVKRTTNSCTINGASGCEWTILANYTISN